MEAPERSNGKNARMGTSRTLVASEDMHSHLVGQLNSALRRPGMYGGETTLRVLVDHLLFMEREPRAGAEHQRLLEERGAWSPTGVTGAFRRLVPGGDYEHGMASVHAELAHRRGWLASDRVLDARAYDALTGRVRRWAETDRVWAEVVAEFGPPSVLFGGGSPFSGKTLGYLTEDRRQPVVFFHLWNGTEPGAEPSWPPARPEPVLLAVRFGGGPFRATFTFTPEGRRLRPAPDEHGC